MNNKKIYDIESDAILDINAFFNKLILLANKDGIHYELKTFSSLDGRSKIFLIAKKDMLSKFDFEKDYLENDYNVIIEKLLSMGSSVIFFKENEGRILVDIDYKKYNVLGFDMKASDLYSNPVFYLYTDELMKALKTLFQIIKEDNQIEDEIIYSIFLKK